MKRTLYSMSNAINVVKGMMVVAGARIATAFGAMAAYAELSLVVIRADGSVENLGVVSRRVVTDTGVQFIVNAFLNTTELETMNQHGSGTGVTAEAASQTALVTETGSRVAGAQSTPANGQYRSTATVTYAATLAITEHGLFSAAAAGTMLDRSLFAAVNVVSGDSIQFQYTLTLSSGG